MTDASRIGARVERALTAEDLEYGWDQAWEESRFTADYSAEFTEWHRQLWPSIPDRAFECMVDTLYDIATNGDLQGFMWDFQLARDQLGLMARSGVVITNDPPEWSEELLEAFSEGVTEVVYPNMEADGSAGVLRMAGFDDEDLESGFLKHWREIRFPTGVTPFIMAANHAVRNPAKFLAISPTIWGGMTRLKARMEIVLAAAEYLHYYALRRIEESQAQQAAPDGFESFLSLPGTGATSPQAKSEPIFVMPTELVGAMLSNVRNLDDQPDAVKATLRKRGARMLDNLRTAGILVRVKCGSHVKHLADEYRLDTQKFMRHCASSEPDVKTSVGR